MKLLGGYRARVSNSFWSEGHVIGSIAGLIGSRTRGGVTVRH